MYGDQAYGQQEYGSFAYYTKKNYTFTLGLLSSTASPWHCVANYGTRTAGLLIGLTCTWACVFDYTVSECGLLINISIVWSCVRVEVGDLGLLAELRHQIGMWYAYASGSSAESWTGNTGAASNSWSSYDSGSDDNAWADYQIWD